MNECIRCHEAHAVTDEGLCGSCHWATKAEVEEGFYAMREYLGAWARYEAWCERKGVSA